MSFKLPMEPRMGARMVLAVRTTDKRIADLDHIIDTMWVEVEPAVAVKRMQEFARTFEMIFNSKLIKPAGFK